MARLPRPLWKKAVPDLSGDPYYPTMSWLAVDGYGFDRAYFDTPRWLDAQRVPKPYSWDGSPDYFLRAVDQGIGRALWFICGGHAPSVAAAAGRFASHRQADLWSGIGLAATFAGGCDADGLASLRSAAGEHGPQLALGAVFAVKARAYAGLVPEHTRIACSALTDTSVDKAVAIADDTAVTSAPHGTQPPYEIWRERIRPHFTMELCPGHPDMPPESSSPGSTGEAIWRGTPQTANDDHAARIHPDTTPSGDPLTSDTTAITDYHLAASGAFGLLPFVGAR